VVSSSVHAKPSICWLLGVLRLTVRPPLLELVLIAIACAWQVRVLARNNWPTARFCFTFVNIINTKSRRQNDM